MRLTFVAPAVILFAMACSDDPATSSQQAVTAPRAARLTMKTLSEDASSVCRANVAARDEVLAKGSADSDSKLSALDTVINDVCY